MLLTKHQKYLLEVLDVLGCAELRQLAALMQKAFAFSAIEDAMRITNACVRQMQTGGLVRVSGHLVSRDAKFTIPQQIEAIDVMLELTAAQPDTFCAIDKHILLRFSLGAPNYKQFVIVSGCDPPPEHELQSNEKVIVLLSPNEKAEIPYSIPVIFAIRQENGSHRFFAKK